MGRCVRVSHAREFRCLGISGRPGARGAFLAAAYCEVPRPNADREGRLERSRGGVPGARGGKGPRFHAPREDPEELRPRAAPRRLEREALDLPRAPYERREHEGRVRRRPLDFTSIAASLSSAAGPRADTTAGTPTIFPRTPNAGGTTGSAARSTASNRSATSPACTTTTRTCTGTPGAGIPGT